MMNEKVLQPEIINNEESVLLFGNPSKVLRQYYFNIGTPIYFGYYF